MRIFHEVDLLPHGLLVKELGGVTKTARWLRLEGTQGVNGRELEGAENAVGGLLRMRLLHALAKRARIAVLHCPGVVDTVGRLLPQDVQALAVDVSHAPLSEVSRLRLQGKVVRLSSGTIWSPASPPSLTLSLIHI